MKIEFFFSILFLAIRVAILQYLTPYQKDDANQKFKNLFNAILQLCRTINCCQKILKII